jgi:hypothetical protein
LELGTLSVSKGVCLVVLCCIWTVSHSLSSVGLLTLLGEVSLKHGPSKKTWALTPLNPEWLENGYLDKFHLPAN